jgi:hypothetical protein
MAPKLYYISDEAYDNLWRDAVAAKYVQRGAERGKGLSEYIAEASRGTFYDARPDEYASLDTVRRSRGLTCYWHDGSIRKARMLSLDEDTIERLCDIAGQFRIAIGKSHKSKKVVIRSTTVTIAYVLEAIGKRWLVTKDINIKKSKEALHAD